MRVDRHTAVVKARVRGRELYRHGLRELQRGKSYAACAADGPPKLWSRICNSALTGLERALAQCTGAPAEQRLTRSLDGARRELARLSDNLIARQYPDAGICVVLIDGGTLHCTAVGGVRAYLHRSGRARRLTDRGDEPHGLLRGQPTRCEIELEPGDVVLAGSITAFDAHAVERIASALDSDPATPTSVLVSLMAEPAAETGSGAAAIAMRVL